MNKIIKRYQIDFIAEVSFSEPNEIKEMAIQRDIAINKEGHSKQKAETAFKSFIIGTNLYDFPHIKITKVIEITKIKEKRILHFITIDQKIPENMGELMEYWGDPYPEKKRNTRMEIEETNET